MAEPGSRLAVVRHFLLLGVLSSLSRTTSMKTPESSIDSALMAAETYNRAGGPQNVDLTLDFVHIHKAFGTNFLFTMMPVMCPERREVNDKMDNIPTEACYMVSCLGEPHLRVSCPTLYPLLPIAIITIIVNSHR